MKTKDMRNDANVLTGFYVDGSLISRSGIQKVVQNIPNVQIIRQQFPFRIGWPRDDFCEFIVDGKTFVAVDLWSENVEFWIVQKEPAEDCPALSRVRDEFAKGKKFFGFLPTRV